MSKEITSRSENYSEWYNDLVLKSGLADYSAVRGCMVIKPYGFTLWENMRDVLDKKFKETGHLNAYFPLFVPKSLFEAEEKNAEGFAKECAVVTHYRLKANPAEPGKLMVDPEAKLEEELVVRPTSEAIIWNTYKKWIQSYRDLPILVNQWANKYFYIACYLFLYQHYKHKPILMPYDMPRPMCKEPHAMRLLEIRWER